MSVSLIAGALALAPMELQELVEHCVIHCSLSQGERNKLWAEMQFCVKKINHHLAQAEKAAKRIKDVDNREMCLAMLQGAVVGMQTRNTYAVVVSAILTAVVKQVDSSARAYLDYLDELESVKMYAQEFDERQIKLWMDE